ncbi:MAG: MBL fold metallo-hydrolase [Bacteroidetes bacterium]|nr:MBL fold metallo-hydrolase [Bacteroidota bacterium]
MIQTEAIVFNDFQVNTHLVWDETGDCLVIDPAFYSDEERDYFKSVLREKGLKVTGQLNTHCHVDHILGVDFMKSELNCPVRAHREELKIIANAPHMGDIFGWSVEPIDVIDDFLEEEKDLTVGNHMLRIIHVPGHSPGSVAIYSEEGGFVITGDALFQGSIGRTDLPGGDYDTLIRSIKEKLLTLPPGTTVFPGHGPSSTIGHERDENPFLK